ncbi:MAG: hypothetical protein DRR42_09810, partial [Gammaproteobacteria bacterium]
MEGLEPRDPRSASVTAEKADGAESQNHVWAVLFGKENKMSRPNGFMIKGRLYPAMAAYTEKAMMDYIVELVEKLEEESLQTSRHMEIMQDKSETKTERIAELESKLTDYKNANVILAGKVDEIEAENGWIPISDLSPDDGERVTMGHYFQQERLWIWTASGEI